MFFSNARPTTPILVAGDMSFLPASDPDTLGPWRRLKMLMQVPAERGAARTVYMQGLPGEDAQGGLPGKSLLQPGIWTVLKQRITEQLCNQSPTIASENRMFSEISTVVPRWLAA